VVLGGLGICMALPRGGKTAQIVGAVVAALAGALVLVDVGLVWLGARAFQRETILTKWK